ncbi:MAG: hypothetical protein OFPI_39750 [Osedax symbiont Rs2]|nr:MAG: hypothetical protein OFPI_39750 [Osedax symbiont Rs2]
MESLIKIFCDILEWNWLGIIQSAAGVATLYIAWLALTSWKKQHRSQRITSLLDELTDAVHDFVQSINLPAQHLQYVHIGIESCKYDMDLNKDLEFPQTVRFIQKDGKESASQMLEYLKPCASSVHKIRSLVIKGQIFNIENFEDSINACNMITWQYDRLQVVCSILNSNNMNWEHPKVIESLGHLSNITYDEMQAKLKENQVSYLNFVKASYSSEYNG